MKSKFIAFSAIYSLLMIYAFSVNAATTFPITQTFSGTQPADWELRSSAAWNTTVSGDATLRLTSAGTSQSGLGFYNESFPSNLGIVAEFRYYAGGGTGADGLTFFLVDGDQVDENNIAAGAVGAALGYAQSSEPHDGIPHAYLGIGFDEFGNFVTNSGGMDQGSATPVPDAVVLRGSGNGVTGYNYLTHTSVASSFSQSIDGGWRIARITVTPSGSDAIVRVEMSWDEGETWSTVINDYVYNEAPPANYKLGFTAGTGGSTNIHAIGNLTVNLPVDLETDLTTSPSGTYERGDTIHYRYTVTNHGPNDANDVTIANTVSTTTTGIQNWAWQLTSTHGSSSSGTSANINAIHVSIPEGDTVTINATGTIGNKILNTTNLDHSITATPENGSIDPSPSDATVAVDITSDGPTAGESALLVITDYAASGGTTTAPTLSDYVAAGVINVATSTLGAVNTMIASSSASDLSEVQEIVNLAVTPAVASVAASNIERTSANLGGNLTRVGSTTIVSLKVEYGLDTSYGNVLSVSGGSVGTYSLSAVDLTCNTTYHFRAYVENGSAERWNGSDLTFTTATCSSGGTATRPSVASPNNVVPATQTNEQKIALIKAQIANLQAILASGGNGGSTTTVFYPNDLPVRDLTGGMSGEDVKALQLLLINLGYQIPAGATGYFAQQTRSALSRYQSENGITPDQGYFGIKTRTQMKAAGLSGLWW